jgi:hypothetical protein
MRIGGQSAGMVASYSSIGRWLAVCSLNVQISVMWYVKEFLRMSHSGLIESLGEVV